MLVTEIGGWVDRFDAPRTARVRDADADEPIRPTPSCCPDGNMLVAGFNTPGRVDEITPRGRIVWTYGPTSGDGRARPSVTRGSLAERDDRRSPTTGTTASSSSTRRTKRIVWQYGHYGVAVRCARLPLEAGRPRPAPGATTRPTPAAPRARARGDRDGCRSRPPDLAAAALAERPHGRRRTGSSAGRSSRQVLLGPPGRLRIAGTLPGPTHDAALAIVGRDAYVFGGGQVASTDAVARIDPQTAWRRTPARSASRSRISVSPPSAARLPRRRLHGRDGTRQRFSATGPGTPLSWSHGFRSACDMRVSRRCGRTIYVAGGVTPAGESDAVVSVSGGRVRRIATLPAPSAHAPLVAFGKSLYLVGGTDAEGHPLDRILRIDPSTGAVTLAGRVPSPLANAAAIAVGGRIVVLGGEGVAASADVLELRPALTAASTGQPG